MTNNAPPEIAPEDSERIDILNTEKYPPEAIMRHLKRYHWAADKLSERFVRPGRVIDYACGTGYGSAILANVAHEVYGRDKDAEAIRIATARHGSTLINFKVRDRIEKHACTCRERFNSDICTCPASVQFDAVVSIETIEHLDPASDYGPQDFLREAYKLINPHGLLILSTPLKDALGPGALRSQFHLQEYSVDELNALVEAAGFGDIRHDDVLPGFICLTARRLA